MRMGILGCGNIGGAVARAVLDGKVSAELVAVADGVRTSQVDEVLELSNGAVRYHDDPAELADLDLDLVFEAAHPVAVRAYALPLLESGKDLVIMSVGGLVESGLLDKLRETAAKQGQRIVLPSGAVSGISTLEAARVLGGLESVTLRTTKAPRSLAGAPYLEENGIDLYELEEKTLIFEGNVNDAIEGFPKNVNVAAAVALAGLGPEQTCVEIFADPEATRTEHRLLATGDFGELEAAVLNYPNPENPRSSYLATLGAISALQKVASEVVMGY